jgi:geranylgeranyl diphosphate synthase, type I
MNKLLRDFFAREKKNNRRRNPIFASLLDTASRQILRGGKRIRPVLAIQAYQAVGGKDIREIEKVSIALEIFHTFLLIHDDIIDQDELRHGGPAAHSVYKKYHRTKSLRGTDLHFGESVALILGDILASYCYRIVLSSKFSQARRIAAVQHMNKVLIDTGYGQIMDVLIGARARTSRREILEVMEYKTARYTIESPLLLGSILGGGKQKIMKQFSKYARPLGIAFQIQDDVLGVFADESKLGKPVGSDLQEGKLTFLILKALASGTAAQKKRLRAILGKSDITDRDIEDARRIIIATGSLAFAKKQARLYAQQARGVMKNISIKKDPKDFLIGMATYIIERDF